ncbi:sugar ABC transporter substrate-binding protein, partial [Kibdelosporangium lantanae]
YECLELVATAKEHDPTGNRDVPSVLLQPQTITKANVKLVVDQKYVTAAELCTGDVQPLCQAAGIS